MKKSILIPILVISALITAGILTFTFISYGTRGTINSSSNYAYPVASTDNENVLISADICDVIIGYNKTPMDFGMEAHFTARIEGLFVKGRGYEEFFQYPQTQNLSEAKMIILSPQHDLFTNPLNFFSNKDVQLIIKLRTDIEYNINVDVAVGHLRLDVPKGVSLGDVNLKTTIGDISVNALRSNFNDNIAISSNTGEIYCNLHNSTIIGDISASTTTGSLRFSLINPCYNAQSNLHLGTTTGSIFLSIEQRLNMFSNVSGSLLVTTGNIEVRYYDESEEISLNCVSSTTTGNAEQYSSLGYSTLYCYDLYLQTTTGNIAISANEN